MRTLLLIQRGTEDAWDLRFEDFETFTGHLEKVSGDCYRLRRFMYGETKIEGKRVAQLLTRFWPEATRFEIVRLDGTRRPVKGLETTSTSPLPAAVFNPPIRVN